MITIKCDRCGTLQPLDVTKALWAHRNFRTRCAHCASDVFGCVIPAAQDYPLTRRPTPEPVR